MFDLLLSLQLLALHLIQLVTPYIPLFVVLGSVSGFVGCVFTVANVIHHW